MFTFSEMLALVQSESSFGAFVFHRRPAGLQATSDLVRCHAGSCEGLSRCRLVGSCVISLHRPTCKTTFARLTQSQPISQSFPVFITFRSMRDTTFFHFRNTFLYKITASFTMVIKRSPGGDFAGCGRSTWKSTCEVPR